MQLVKGRLPPQPRARTLAALEAEITRTEAVCAERRARVAALEAVGRSSRSTRGLLQVVEERLLQLRRSREVLLRGEEGHEDDEPELQP